MNQLGQTQSERWSWGLLALLLLLTAHYSVGYYRPDEHYQILEFAALKLGRIQPGAMPWEFSEQIRPTLQPWMALGFAKLFGGLGMHPFWQVELMRLFSGFIGFLILRRFFEHTKEELKPEWQPVYRWVLCLLWFLPFITVRFGSETWSAFGLLLAYLATRKALDKPAVLSWLWVGVWLGLSFLFRYQTGVAGVGLLLWLWIIKRVGWKATGAFVVGGLVVVVFGIVLDRIYYGNWVISAYGYLEFNILEGGAATYGVSPWYHYAVDLINKTHVVWGVLTLLGFGWWTYRKPSHAITWIAVPFVLIHSMIGHKEMRFLFPLAYFAPIWLVFLAESLPEKFSRSALAKWFGGLLIAFNSILLIGALLFSGRGDIKAQQYVQCSNQGKPVTLYVMEPDGYHPVGLVRSFYDDPKTAITEIQIEDPAQAKRQDGPTYLLTSRRASSMDYTLPTDQFELVYQSFPRWVETNLNLFGWVDRTSFVRVYRVR